MAQMKASFPKVSIPALVNSPMSSSARPYFRARSLKCAEDSKPAILLSYMAPCLISKHTAVENVLCAAQTTDPCSPAQKLHTQATPARPMARQRTQLLANFQNAEVRTTSQPELLNSSTVRIRACSALTAHHGEDSRSSQSGDLSPTLLGAMSQLRPQARRKADSFFFTGTQALLSAAAHCWQT